MKTYYVLNLFLAMSIIACANSINDVPNEQKKEKFHFVDDELLMRDVAKETQFVDNALHAAATLHEKKKKQEKTNALPLNSREQAIKFFKYLNVATENNGKYRFVFYDKVSDKIVDLSLNEKDKSIYIGLNREQFEDKLKAGDIDFKLLENKNSVSSLLSNPTLTKSINNEDDPVPTDTMYDKVFYRATGSDDVLGGLTRLCTQLLWYKKEAYPGFVLSDPRPGVEGSETFLTEMYFGDFHGSASGFSYRESSKKIEGHVMGRFEVQVEVSGLKIGSNYKIEAQMKVDMDNHVEYNATSSLFR